MPLTIFNLGHTVTVTYTVIRGNAEPVTSQPLIFYVLSVSQSDLPRPFITQASDSGEGLVLDVNRLTEFTLRINAWILQMRGQFFWLRLLGTNADGSPFNEVYWSAPSNVVGPEFSKGFHAQNFSADPLKGLENHSILTLVLKVGLQGSQDETLSQPFAHRSYIVRTGAPITPVRPLIQSVKDLDQDIIDGGSTAHASVTIEGTAMVGGEVEIFDGLISKGTARADSGRWEFLMVDLGIGRHVFKAVALYGSNEESNTWTINVALPLPLPLTIKEAPDNTNLDPAAARERLTAVLNYDMVSTDLVRVMWVGTPGAGTRTTAPVQAGNISPREILLPTTLVTANVGTRVTVTFSYTRGTSAPVVSEPLSLNVLANPAGEQGWAQ
ncbi:hypothetical protein [Pseudomonas brassicacearum]|uniref:hypothetical protein n=1 Tax=Pseudomonas brassicacearum TaxID=930166 RepID=UPI0011CD5E2A|nr:hypothetical protein [Pseudomonas brassicacearum]